MTKLLPLTLLPACGTSAPAAVDPDAPPTTSDAPSTGDCTGEHFQLQGAVELAPPRLHERAGVRPATPIARVVALPATCGTLTTTFVPEPGEPGEKPAQCAPQAVEAADAVVRAELAFRGLHVRTATASAPRARASPRRSRHAGSGAARSPRATSASPRRSTATGPRRSSAPSPRSSCCAATGGSRSASAPAQ